MPSRRGVQVACQNMDNCMEIAMEELTKFSDFILKIKNFKKATWQLVKWRR